MMFGDDTGASLVWFMVMVIPFSSFVKTKTKYSPDSTDMVITNTRRRTAISNMSLYIPCLQNKHSMLLLFLRGVGENSKTQDSKLKTQDSRNDVSL